MVFEKTRALCESVGWRYRRVGQMARVRAANLRWLAGYRHPRCRRPGIAVELIETFICARALLDGVRRVGDPIAVLPTLFDLLWAQELTVDIGTAPLDSATLVGGESP